MLVGESTGLQWQQVRAIAANAPLKCKSLPAGGEGNAGLASMAIHALQNAASHILGEIAAA